MRLLLEINVFLFLFSVAALAFIFRYRVHFHVEYRPRKARRRPEEGKVSGEASTPLLKDLESALRNLGATRGEARTMAAEALRQGPGDFDALILRAMQGKGGRR